MRTCRGHHLRGGLLAQPAPQQPVFVIGRLQRQRLGPGTAHPATASELTTQDSSRLMRRANGAAVERSRGVRAAAAVMMARATTVGASPPVTALATT